MKKIEAYIRPEKLEDVKEALNKQKVTGMSVTQTMGFGTQKGWKEIVRGTEVDYNFLHKIKLEIVAEDDRISAIADSIVESAYTGEFGDGKIFIYDVQDAIRIRTKERGSAAI